MLSAPGVFADPIEQPLLELILNVTDRKLLQSTSKRPFGISGAQAAAVIL